MRQPLNLNSVEVPILFTTRFWATAHRRLIIDNKRALSATPLNVFTLQDFALGLTRFIYALYLDITLNLLTPVSCMFYNPQPYFETSGRMMPMPPMARHG